MNYLSKHTIKLYVSVMVVFSIQSVTSKSKKYRSKGTHLSLLEDAQKIQGENNVEIASRAFQTYPFHAHTFLSQEINPYPAEFSFWIVDLKFDDKKNMVKICEFGNGRYAGFRGYHSLHGRGVIWQRFWRFLELLHIPIWYVGGSFEHEVFRRSFAPSNGKNISTLAKFFPNKSTKNNGVFDRQNILTYDGLLVFNSGRTSRANIKSMKQKFPRIMHLSEATDYFISNKKRTNLLFENDQELMLYKPKFKLYQKLYYPALAQQVIDDFDCEIFVIKPLNSSQGRGVIIVDKENLDDTLKLILSTDGSLEKFKNNPSYYFWKQDPNKEFLVEEYAQSKEILLGKKLYDPTMRICCFLYNHNRQIRTTFFAAYWKLPEKGLNQEGTLTEKHKSKIIPGKACSARVSSQDFTAVSAILSEALPKLYLKMLAQYFGENSET